ncbi:MAG: hypothetical protein QM679_08980, partial [Patulibacter sp.]
RLLGARTVTPDGYRGGARAALTPLADEALALLAGAIDPQPGEPQHASDRPAGGEAAMLRRLVIHVDAPDEAAHERDAALKVEALEAIDTELLLPLVAWLHDHGGTLEIAIDHGCDPRDGQHHGDPTPALRWTAGADAHAPGGPDPRDIDPDAPGLRSGLDPDDLPVMALPKRRASASAQTGRRLTERWVAPLPIETPEPLAAR